MKLQVTKVEVWSAPIEDRPGAAAEKLERMAKAGASFEFVFARRAPEQPGQGVLFVCPVKGTKVTKAAREAGFAPSETLQSVRIEEKDAPGVAAKVTGALAAAGVNLRAISASALGKKFVSYLALDSQADAAKAASVLKKLS